jgi:hypothetical protein
MINRFELGMLLVASIVTVMFPHLAVADVLPPHVVEGLTRTRSKYRKAEGVYRVFEKFAPNGVPSEKGQVFRFRGNGESIRLDVVTDDSSSTPPEKTYLLRPDSGVVITRSASGEYAFATVDFDASQLSLIVHAEIMVAPYSIRGFPVTDRLGEQGVRKVTFAQTAEQGKSARIMYETVGPDAHKALLHTVDLENSGHFWWCTRVRFQTSGSSTWSELNYTYSRDSWDEGTPKLVRYVWTRSDGRETTKLREFELLRIAPASMTDADFDPATFGLPDPDRPSKSTSRWAVFAGLLVILAVLGGLSLFFLWLARKRKQAER